MTKPICLTIAGSDSSGGAGIQADLKTMLVHKTFPMSVITLITAQNSFQITKLVTIPLKLISAQLDVLFKDYKINYVKIGALHNKKIINLVVKKLIHYRPKIIVVDPVMVSKSKVRLMKQDDVKYFMTKFAPLASLITPNLDEVKVMLDRPMLTTINDMKQAAKDLQTQGFKNVLIKGGHLNSKLITDVLRINHRYYLFENKKIFTINTHGTGCTLSSAITANLAHGHSLFQAVNKAIAYTHQAIIKNLNIGSKHGPIDHYWQGANNE